MDANSSMWMQHLLISYTPSSRSWMSRCAGAGIAFKFWLRKRKGHCFFLGYMNIGHIESELTHSRWVVTLLCKWVRTSDTWRPAVAYLQMYIRIHNAQSILHWNAPKEYGGTLELSYIMASGLQLHETTKISTFVQIVLYISMSIWGSFATAAPTCQDRYSNVSSIPISNVAKYCNSFVFFR